MHADWRTPVPAPAQDFWRSGGGVVLPDGSADTTEGIAHTGLVAVGRNAPANPAADLHVGGSTIFAMQGGANFPVSGPIGSAAGTVDQFAGLRVPQVTAGIALTLPAPTNATIGRTFRVANSGTAHVVVAGRLVAPASFADFVWTGAAWVGDGTPVRVRASLAAAEANSTAVMNPIAGLSVSIPVPGWYRVVLLAYYDVNATTTGIGINFQGGTAGISDFAMVGVLSSTATTAFNVFYQSRAQNWATAQSSRVNGNLAEMKAVFRATSAGTFIPHFRSELAGAAVTLLAGSSIDVERTG